MAIRTDDSIGRTNLLLTRRLLVFRLVIFQHGEKVCLHALFRAILLLVRQLISNFFYELGDPSPVSTVDFLGRMITLGSTF